MKSQIQRYFLALLATTQVLIGGDLHVSIVNGTSNSAGRVDRVALMDLSAGMVEIASVDAVSGSTTFSDVQGNGQKQYLIQANVAGVTYSRMFVPAPDITNWETTVTVYSEEKEPRHLGASVPFFVIYVFEDRLYVQKRLILENHSDPPVTYADPPGLINVYVPENISQMDYLTFKAGSMPLKTQLIDSEGVQVIPNALKPGHSEIDIAYYLPYEQNKTELSEKVNYDIDHFHVYVMPLGIEISAPGLVREGTDNDNGLAIYAIKNVKAGTDIPFMIAGKGMSESESREQQNTGQIVVEHRIAFTNKLIMAGVFAALILIVLFIAIIRQSSDLKQESIDSLGKQKKALLNQYARLGDSPEIDLEQERILHQLISVYKTLDRIR